ncbi:MAG: hypothetical protein WC846_04420 [Candidatus Gracilibacteria bacterium]|jgi:hypothetical protein
MAQFEYTAVNAAGKKLSGVIGAQTEDEARKQLNTFGISLLAIEKIGETQVATVTGEPGTSSDLPKFEFEAYDKLNRKVLGTIPAASRYSAFKRLMEEYQFEVAYVVPMGATEDDRTKAKQEGLESLKAEYEAQIEKTGGEEDEEKMIKEFEGKRTEMLRKVDFILEKIKGLIVEYGEFMKPESKKNIQSYIDKLLRIKSSTNLDYIEHTSEELLKKVQDEEIFLHKEQMLTARGKLRVQAEEMMAELHSRPAELKMEDQIEEVRKGLSKSENPLLKGLGQIIARFIPSAEEKTLKQKIKTVGRQIWIYRKIVWFAPAEAKEEAQSSLTRLKEEKVRLLEGLRELKEKLKVSPETGEKEPIITEEINGFLGWLLAFYLATYFISYYLISKSIPFENPLPGNFNLLSSELLRQVLISIFLWYILITLRLNHLRYKSWANTLTIPLGIIMNCTLIFNL